MSKAAAKTPAKPGDDEAESAQAPKKRSKLVLAAAAVVPLLLAGGGWYGWTMWAGGDAHASGGQDGIHVAALPTEVKAESSFTHSFAISVMIADSCGAVETEALEEAVAEEAHADGVLVNLSWVAASRRTGLLDAKTCGHLMSEVRKANAKAGGAGGGGKGHAAPAHH